MILKSIKLNIKNGKQVKNLYCNDFKSNNNLNVKFCDPVGILNLNY